MSTIPDVDQTIANGGLGLSGVKATGIQVKIGCSSLGTANAPAAYADGEQLKAAFGTGPMVEAALVALQLGSPVIVCKAPSSTAGAASAVTKIATGTGTVTVAGGALDAYSAIVEITNPSGTALAGNGGLFRYSLDGGRTYSPEFALPAAGTFLIPNTGLTLTFAIPSGAGFLTGDRYTFTSTGPSCSLAEVGLAIDAVKAANLPFEFIHVVGAPATASAAAMFAALDTKAAGFITSRLYEGAFIIMEMPEDTDANLKAALTSVSNFVSVSAGYLYLTSPLDMRQVKRPVAWVATARLGAIEPGTDAARVKDGPLLGVTGLTRDESKTPGLDAAGFTTARTFQNKPGYYLTNFRMFSDPSSDFRYAQHRRCMNIAAAENYAQLVEELSDDVLVDKATGAIDEGAAQAIENKARNRISGRLGGNVTSVVVTVDRTTNLLSTEEISTSVDIVPKGYLKSIKTRVGYKNPGLAT